MHRSDVSAFLRARKEALADLWADDLAREGLRDLAVVLGIMVAAIKAGMSLAGSDLGVARKQPDCVPPLAYQAPEPPSADALAFSPAPMILPVESAQEAAPATDEIEQQEAPRHRRHWHRRRG